MRKRLTRRRREGHGVPDRPGEPGCKTKKDTLRARITSQTPEFFKGNMRPPGSDIVIFLEKDFEDKRSEETSEE